MKRLNCCLFLFLLTLPFCVLAADNKPKPAQADKAKGGNAAAPPVAVAEPATDQSDEPKPSDDEPAPPKPRKVSSRPTAMDITPQPNGLKALSIHFRWALYPDASIEVRLVPASGERAPAADEKKAEPEPLNFHQFVKDKVQEQIFDCLDHPQNGGKVHSFTKSQSVYNNKHRLYTDVKFVYKIVGRRNSLGNEGVHVEVYEEDTDPSKNPAAAFLQLDTWAVDKETLSLDLDREQFAKPGTLFVWFFRGDKNVWQEQIRWPGYK